MTHNKRPSFLRIGAPVGLAVLIAFTGCSDSDDPTGPGNTVQLSETQAMELFEVIMAVGDVDVGFMGANTAALSGTAAFAWEDEFPCPNGGHVHQAAQISSFPDEAGNGSVSVSSTDTHNDCGVTVDAGQVTVNGAPNLGWSFSFDTQDWEWVGNMTGEFSGAIDLSGAYSGTCQIQLNYSGSAANNTYSVNGTVCGTPVNESFTG